MRSVFFCLLLVGCAANTSLSFLSISEQNQRRIQQLCPGMCETTVLEIMRQPYGTQTVSVNGETYMIWFYVTQTTLLGQTAMTAQNLTPLIFQDGELLGWGRGKYRNLFKPKKTPDSAKEQPSTLEDKNIEKQLNTSK